MLAVGDLVPSARIWAGPGEEEADLRHVLAGDGHALLCFYPFDWSPG